MTKATCDGLAYFYKFCAKICLDDREFRKTTIHSYFTLPQQKIMQ